MAFTYDASSSSTFNRVRRFIGDTNSNDQLLTDAEVEDFIDLAGDDAIDAAATAIELGILPKIARDVDRSNMGMSSSRDQKTQHYQDLAKRLRARAVGTASVYAGGISIDNKDTQDDNDDNESPVFYRGMDDLIE